MRTYFFLCLLLVVGKAIASESSPSSSPEITHGEERVLRQAFALNGLKVQETRNSQGIYYYGEKDGTVLTPSQAQTAYLHLRARFTAKVVATVDLESKIRK